jgi:site-specific DNA-cytosine methylase
METIEALKVLEFYSGIGGWSQALKNLTDLKFEVVAAFDINTTANVVYESNYGLKPIAKSLEKLNEKTLESYAADVWLMSPPCQPFTRNNQTFNRDDNDARSNSLLHLLDLISKLSKQPTYIALENVVGFEKSNCCRTLLNTLLLLNYSCDEFILTPTSLNIPNERPRYYLIAKKNKLLNNLKSVIKSSEKCEDFDKRKIFQTFPTRSTKNNKNNIKEKKQQLHDFLKFDFSTEELVFIIFLIFFYFKNL